MTMTPEMTAALQTIQIPQELIPILKEYTKTAIRQQPQDILLWSERYFRTKISSTNTGNTTKN